jgi:cytochrome P450
MPVVSELELPRLPFDAPDFGENPMPHFAAARREHDWLAASPLGPVITDYAAIDEILRLDGNMKMSGGEIVDLMGARGTGWGDFAEDMMLARSGEDHARLRASVSSAFGPGSVQRMRPIMRATVSALLDEWAPKGAFDFAQFAARFPVRIMFGLIGASPDKLPAILDALEVQGSSFNMQVDNMAAIEESYQVLWRFVDDLIEERADSLGNGDLLDELIAASTAGRLTSKELRQMLIFLFAAGYDTSKNLLTLLMDSMIQNPAIWKRCAEDRDYCRKVVKEQLRHTSPSNTYRTVVEAFEYRGVTFPVGTMLIFPLGISGRDERVFADPMRFDPERQGRAATLAFGRGMHICLGQFLAQANVEEGTHLIAQRLANPRLAGKPQWRSFAGVWGIKSLPIEFDPTPAASPTAAEAAQ